MRILIACEFSGTVRDAFTAMGHHAVSCDLLPTETPGLHYKGDVRDILDGWEPVKFTANCDPDGDGWCQVRDCDPDSCDCIRPTQDNIEYMEKNGILFGRPEDKPHWDMMIAHPDCTYLCSNGLHWNGRVPGRAKKTEEALDFVRVLMNAPIHRIAIENPIGRINTAIRPPDQYIQPYEFGHDASKRTGLWLKNLPPLKPTKLIAPRIVEGKKRWANQCDSGQNKLGPSPDRWKHRAATYPGWADSMAKQWNNLPELKDIRWKMLLPVAKNATLQRVI